MGSVDAARETQMCANPRGFSVRYAVSTWSRCGVCCRRAGDGHIDLCVAIWRLRATHDDDAGCFAPANGALQPHAPSGGAAEFMRMPAAMLGDPAVARRNHFGSPVLSTNFDRFLSSDIRSDKSNVSTSENACSFVQQTAPCLVSGSLQSRGPCVPRKSAPVTTSPARSVIALTENCGEEVGRQ